MLNEKKIAFFLIILSFFGFFIVNKTVESSNNVKSTDMNSNPLNQYKLESIDHIHENISSYEIVIGWVNEPAYANVFNAVSMEINMWTNGGTNKTPVIGAENNLTVIISKGGAQTTPQPIQPSDENPGLYTVPFMPTQVGGTYVTHTNGILGNYTIIDLKIDLDPTLAPLLFPSFQSSTSTAGKSSPGFESLPLIFGLSIMAIIYTHKRLK